MRRLRPPGLRVRLVLALLLTSAVTLAVAALTLLPPLERRLRDEEVRALLSTAQASRTAFQDADVPRGKEAATLAPQIRSLERRANARVVLFDSTLQPVVDTRPPIGGSRPLDTSDTRDPFGDAGLALRRGRPVSNIVGGSQGVARVALPLKLNGRHYVLVLHERLADVARSVDTVKSAFLSAALVGFATAVVIGIGLATTLLRRLRRLRDAARRLGARGLSEEAPRDSGRDEIGDLARAFSSMQTQLRSQEEARKRFVATASHELRNPLASLDGVLELAADDLHSERLDVDDARKQVARARDQSRRLSALAADLLDLSRLDADVELRREPIELGEMCRAAASEFELRVRERHLTLRVEAPDTAVWAEADPGGVARIISILVDNALRFTPHDLPVEVALDQANGHAEISVTDRGPGVAPAEQEAIFDRFSQGTAQGNGGGFGLGLAIGRELAARMGGSLALEPSNGPGARFVLRLPSAETPA
ncbi:MAG TPA: HAMP domain-containing sensor histidine kinase [Solirubrobacteraceae bacterium]|nr:HAMP domain-containing sensor histidine kinase [Solirubrobacteraceae bacterium]